MKVYRYLTGRDDVHFCARVSKALNDGYELYGAPTMTFNGVDVIVGQVIVKDEVDESELSEQFQNAYQLQFEKK